MADVEGLAKIGRTMIARNCTQVRSFGDGQEGELVDYELTELTDHFAVLEEACDLVIGHIVHRRKLFGFVASLAAPSTTPYDLGHFRAIVILLFNRRNMRKLEEDVGQEHLGRRRN